MLASDGLFHPAKSQIDMVIKGPGAMLSEPEGLARDFS